MAKLSTLIAALAILAFTGSAAVAGCTGHERTADSSQQSQIQTAEQTPLPSTPKTDDAAQ
jgi:hypothetical protein